MGVLGIIAGTAANVATGAVNNVLAADAASNARYENFGFNELAAEHADTRTRNLYNDLYSPQALLNQYQKAGLSPSLMFSKGGGTSGGIAGAQGQGTAGQSTPFVPLSLLEGAQIGLLEAQTKNIEADTRNKETENPLIKEETEAKKLLNEYQTLFNEKYTAETKILGYYIINDDGSKESLYQQALKYDDYEQFVKHLHKVLDEEQKLIVSSEIGQQTLRDIWKTAKTMNEDILSFGLRNTNTQRQNEKLQSEKDKIDSEKTNIEADTRIKEENEKLLQWENQLVNAMKNAGFAQMNAQAAVKFLKAQIQQSELTELQKGAFNRLINKMKDGTMKDIVIVMGLLLGQGLQRVSFSGKL